MMHTVAARTLVAALLLSTSAAACSASSKKSDMNYDQAQRTVRGCERELNQLFTGVLHGHTDSLDSGGPLPCTDSSDPKKQTTVLYTRGFIVTGLSPDFAVTRKAFIGHWAKQAGAKTKRTATIAT